MMKENPVQFTKDVKNYIHALGIPLVGIADLTPFKAQYECHPQDLLVPYTFGISIGLPLPNESFQNIKEKPTPEYAQAYKNANEQLDKYGKEIVQWIESKTFHAYLIPASKVMDSESLSGHISHKAVGKMAGLGWLGKSLLLINPEYGPRFRLATILTDMPLISDNPPKNQCGSCRLCVISCPAHAIKDVAPKEMSHTREDAVDMQKCYDLLKKYREMPGIVYTICGVCVKVCPYGLKNKKSQ
jgi:epoxyqueuosine reductase QueG